MEKQNIIISVFVAFISVLLIYSIYYITRGYSENNKPSKTEDVSNDSQSTCNYTPPPSNPPSTIPYQESPIYAPTSEIEFTEKEQVFNVGNNIFTYKDAPAVCKAYGAKLASFDQLKKAYDEGANWCNYGWTSGQMALYPTQYKSWKKIQSGPEKYRKSCGKPGINGGYFENPNLKFGVNCYGKKPETDNSNTQIGCPLQYFDEETLNFNQKVDEYTTKINDFTILPFNKKEWSD